MKATQCSAAGYCYTCCASEQTFLCASKLNKYHNVVSAIKKMVSFYREMMFPYQSRRRNSHCINKGQSRSQGKIICISICMWKSFCEDL